MVVGVVVAGSVASGCWAWWYQRCVMRLVTRKPVDVRKRKRALVAASVGRGFHAPTLPLWLAGPVAGAVEHDTPAPVCSVLGWEGMAVHSFVVLDDLVLLACRREAADILRARRGTRCRPTASIRGSDDRAAGR